MATENITSENTPRPLGFWLHTIKALLRREFEAASDQDDMDRDEIAAGIHTRISGVVPEADLATTLSTLEAIARELGWDPAETPQHDRGRGRGHGHNRRGEHGDRSHGRPEHGAPGCGRREHGRPAHGAPGCGRREHGGPEHGGHSEHFRRGHGHGHGRHSEHAYERGFDAGFTRGAESRNA